MNEYSFEIFDNNIIALIEGKRVLLDTGALTSISDGCSLRILGNNYSFSSNFMGFSIDQLNKLLRTEINILLGADVLKTLNFFVALHPVVRIWTQKLKLLFIQPHRSIISRAIPLKPYLIIWNCLYSKSRPSCPLLY